MKVVALTGSKRSARGLRYICQLVSRLKNLSRPARKGPSPRPIRSAHHAELICLSDIVIFSSYPTESGRLIWLQGDQRKKSCNLSSRDDSILNGEVKRRRTERSLTAMSAEPSVLPATG